MTRIASPASYNATNSASFCTPGSANSVSTPCRVSISTSARPPVIRAIALSLLLPCPAANGHTISATARGDRAARFRSCPISEGEMAYETYRVEVTRDETLATGGIGIEITAYIDRMPETHDYTVG